MTGCEYLYNGKSLSNKISEKVHGIHPRSSVFQTKTTEEYKRRVGSNTEKVKSPGDHRSRLIAPAGIKDFSLLKTVLPIL